MRSKERHWGPGEIKISIREVRVVFKGLRPFLSFTEDRVIKYVDALGRPSREARLSTPMKFP